MAPATRVERILALATERGPLGVCQHDFDYPARDGGRPIPRIHETMRMIGGRLVQLDTSAGRLWVLPAFVPARYEYFRTGCRCVQCGAVHPGDWDGPCGTCGRYPLLQVRVVARIDDTIQEAR